MSYHHNLKREKKRLIRQIHQQRLDLVEKKLNGWKNVRIDRSWQIVFASRRYLVLGTLALWRQMASVTQ